MEWQGSVPGKTFLFGEYLVLAGGPCVVLGTRPRFELKVTEGSGISPFREGSPAHGLFLSQRERLEGLRLEFVNPYGAGGFGASGAEFVLLARFLEEGLGLSFLPPAEASISAAARVLDFFYSFERAAKRSSGADVLSQWLGESIVYQPRRVLEKFRWPFAALEFSIFSTHQKINTHEHIATIEPEKISGLSAAGQGVMAAIRTGDEAVFVNAVAGWTRLLDERGLTVAASVEHARSFQAAGAVHARGCGALGADTILVLYRAEERARLREHGVARGLKFQAGSEQLLGGTPLAAGGH